MKQDFSCKDCPDRQIEPVNCHSYCEVYLEQRKYLDETKQNRRKYQGLSILAKKTPGSRNKTIKSPRNRNKKPR